LNEKNFYSRFLDNLKNSQKWPGPYMFKFIVKEKETNIDEIKKIFIGMKVKFSVKKSSKNNYTSLSVSLILKSPESVISIYKDISKFKGVISL
tara:strand:- start:539 stop:817 length:279 start_codon:yes stop_codon:yes gene_type:complete